MFLCAWEFEKRWYKRKRWKKKKYINKKELKDLLGDIALHFKLSLLKNNSQ